MRYKVDEIKSPGPNRCVIFYKIIHLLRIIYYAGNHRQDHDGEEESRNEFLQNEKVKYFKKSLQLVF